MSDEEPKLIAIDEEANHEIVHGCRFGKAHGATYEPFNPGPQVDVFALDFVCVLFANFVLLGGDMPLVSTPPISVEAPNPKGLQWRHPGQINLKGGSFSDMAGHGDVPSMADHNPMDDGESHPRPFSRGFGRKEGLKDMVEVVMGNTGASITHRAPYIEAWRQDGKEGSPGSVDFDGVEAHVEQTGGVLHGLGSIGTELDDDLVQRGRIAEDKVGFVRNVLPERNGGGEHCPQGG
jgi:hypothetical protein